MFSTSRQALNFSHHRIRVRRRDFQALALAMSPESWSNIGSYIDHELGCKNSAESNWRGWQRGAVKLKPTNFVILLTPRVA
jgi:hypothetical protein